VLVALLEQRFVRGEGGDFRPRGPDGPAPGRPIWTPHDPEVQCGKKRSQERLGNKVHLAETADPTDERPNVITDVLVTAPQQEDSTVLPTVAERARFRTPETDTLLADGGYASGTNSEAAAELGTDLVAPPRRDTRQRNGQFSPEAFGIDLEHQVATCPAGQRSERWRVRERDVQICFPTAVCRACPRCHECTTRSPGRRLAVSRHYDQLCRDRVRAASEEFWNLYKSRAGVEATFSKLIHACGLRRSRYRGEAGRTWHAFAAAAALNVRRLLRWLAGEQTRKGRGGLRAALLAPLAAARSGRRAAQPLRHAFWAPQSIHRHLTRTPNVIAACVRCI